MSLEETETSALISELCKRTDGTLLVLTANGKRGRRGRYSAYVRGLTGHQIGSIAAELVRTIGSAGVVSNDYTFRLPGSQE